MYSTAEFERGNSENLRSEMDAIRNNPVSVTTINHYADTAFDALVNIAAKATTIYQQNPTLYFTTDKEAEDAAFDYSGLGEISETLDFISLKSTELRDIDALISNANKFGSVLVPPDESGMQSRGENASNYDSKQTVPKLKTTLFVIANEFDIDIASKEQLEVSSGIIKQEMMRNSSYYLVEIKKINRTVLVCDEIGNITFVFDSEVLSSMDITSQQLRDMTKLELSALLTSDSTVGQKFRYSEDYVSNTIRALHNPSDQKTSIQPIKERGGRYLRPKAPESVLTLTGIMRAYSIKSRGLIEKVVQEISEDIGETESYAFGSRTAIGYTPHQQDLIIQGLDRKGYFIKPPEGYVNRHNMAKEWGIAFSAIDRTIAALAESIGDTDTYRASAGMQTFYSPEQVELIYNSLKNSGIFEPPAPEGFLSISGIARAFKIEHLTVSNTINSMGEQIGDTAVYMFSTQAATAYTPVQQQLIREECERRGHFVGEPPEGAKSNSQFSKDIGFGNGRTLTKAIDVLSEELGEIKRYRVGSRGKIAQCLSKEQQAILINYFETHDMLVKAPATYLNAQQLGEKLKSSQLTRKAIRELSDQLGEVVRYRAKSGVVPHYSEDQQKLIESHMRDRGYLDNEAPEGYLPISAIARSIGANHAAIKKFINSNTEQLGEVRSYKFKTLVTTGFSPEQQAWIIEQFKLTQKR